jgi:hypothetical protein
LSGIVYGKTIDIVRNNDNAVYIGDRNNRIFKVDLSTGQYYYWTLKIENGSASSALDLTTDLSGKLFLIASPKTSVREWSESAGYASLYGNPLTISLGVTSSRSDAGVVYVTDKTADGVFSIVKMKPCSAGNYSSSGFEPCTACAAGKYSSTTGSKSCNNCNYGTYSSTTGAASCTPCPVGTIGYGMGLTSCTLVPAGTYQDQTGQ